MPRLSVPSIGGGRKVMRMPEGGGGGVGCWAERKEEGLRRNEETSSASRRAPNCKLPIANGKYPLRIANGKSPLRIVTPVQIREDIVAPLAVREETLIDVLGAHLVVKAGEAQQMVLRALGRVVAR